MKNLTAAQIKQIKSLDAYTPLDFHGNRKMVGTLPVDVVKTIVRKKRARINLRTPLHVLTPTQRVRFLLETEVKNVSFAYTKKLIEGGTGIYYASPVFLHKDYNKCRVFDKNETTLKLMRIFNALSERQRATK